MSELALVIEDDEDLSNIFAEALQNAGYEVETIRDGIQARQRLTEVVPSIVLLDMHIPKVTGPELLADIRSDPRLTDVRVVVATADARLGDEFREVADFTLIKPISFIQLRDLTKRLHRT